MLHLLKNDPNVLGNTRLQEAARIQPGFEVVAD